MGGDRRHQPASSFAGPCALRNEGRLECAFARCALSRIHRCCARTRVIGRRRIATLSRRPPEDPFVDRLLVAAIIEARSCERFKLVMDALRVRGDEPALLLFYEDLFASEARHYRTFVDLAEAVKGDAAVVRQRLEGMARAEGELIQRLGTTPTMHG